LTSHFIDVLHADVLFFGNQLKRELRRCYFWACDGLMVHLNMLMYFTLWRGHSILPGPYPQ